MVRRRAGMQDPQAEAGGQLITIRHLDGVPYPRLEAGEQVITMRHPGGVQHLHHAMTRGGQAVTTQRLYGVHRQAIP
jgi:hypothetical protein